MCAINPKFETTITFKVYTSHGTRDEFMNDIFKGCTTELLEAEFKLNASSKLRWHLQPISKVIQYKTIEDKVASKISKMLNTNSHI